MISSPLSYNRLAAFAKHARVMRGFGKACVAWGSDGELIPSLSARLSNHEIPTIVGIFHFEETPQQAAGLIKEFMKNEKDAAQRSLMI